MTDPRYTDEEINATARALDIHADVRCGEDSRKAAAMLRQLLDERRAAEKERAEIWSALGVASIKDRDGRYGSLVDAARGSETGRLNCMAALEKARGEHRYCDERFGRACDDIKRLQAERAADAAHLAALRDEANRLRAAGFAQDNAVCQLLGPLLGYPWYKDDPANFPDATEADGVCTGEHGAESIASEAAEFIKKQAAELATLRAEKQRREQEDRR